MRITWSRVLIGVGMLVCLLSIGTLEVLSQRIRVDPAATAPRADGGAPEPSWDSLAPRDDLLSLEADPAADSDLGLVKPGDIVRVEPSHGQIQKILVLRTAWQEITSPEW